MSDTNSATSRTAVYGFHKTGIPAISIPKFWLSGLLCTSSAMCVSLAVRMHDCGLAWIGILYNCYVYAPCGRMFAASASASLARSTDACMIEAVDTSSTYRHSFSLYMCITWVVGAALFVVVLSRHCLLRPPCGRRLPHR